MCPSRAHIQLVIKFACVSVCVSVCVCVSAKGLPNHACYGDAVFTSDSMGLE